MNDTPRARGRPRKFDPDVALKAAAERFRTHGYAGTSLDDLVDATGLARPSLYAAFGDKRAIYLATLDRATARMARDFDRLIAQELPLRQSLELMFRVTIDGYLTGERAPSGCIMVSTSATRAVDDLEVRDRLNAFVAIEDAKVAALLTACGDVHATRHARIVTAMIHSLSVRARAGASIKELDAIAADCVEMIAGN